MSSDPRAESYAHEPPDAADRTDDDFEPGTETRYSAAIVVFAMSRGLSVEAIEAASGHTLKALLEPGQRVPMDTIHHIWRQMRETLPNRALSLEMAAAAPYSFFGPLGFGAQYADSVLDALEALVRYRRLVSTGLELGIEVDDAADTASLWLRHDLDTIDQGGLNELGLAISVRFFREIVLVPDALRHVTFAFDPMGDVREYEAFFGVPVSFNTGRASMVLDRSAALAPLAHRNKTAFAYLLAHQQAALQNIQRRDQLADVRSAIVENAKRSEYGADALAKRMGMSLRSLQRFVSAHGSQVSRLIDEARLANALELLRDSRVSIAEIAYVLGYSEERAFRRAFRRMSGTSPSQHRRAMREG